MTPSTSSKRYYPLFLSLDGRLCLVIGGGTVGERKARRLIEYGAKVFLVAERLSPWLEVQVSTQLVSLLDTSYHADLMNDMVLVFAATNDKSLNRQIAADARERGVWCNMATDPEEGDVLLPSIFERGSLTVAFSTGGVAPGVAKLIRERFETEFGPEWVASLDFLGRLRAAIQDLGSTESDNQRIFRELAALSIQNWIAEQDHEGLIEAVAAVCGQQLGWERIRRLWDDTWKQLS